ncbi:MAG: hypothetical protein LBC68_04765 [Prevotellaceae bacterium]|nr:hypothetical protein [Prevotellaceae bacterium]
MTIEHTQSVPKWVELLRSSDARATLFVPQATPVVCVWLFTFCPVRNYRSVENDITACMSRGLPTLT